MLHIGYIHYGVGGNSVDFSDLGMIYYPVMKSNKRLIITDADRLVKIEISQYGELYFRQNNQNTSYFYTSKISPIWLLNPTASLNYELDEDNNLIILGSTFATTGFDNTISVNALGSRVIQTNASDAAIRIGVIISGNVYQSAYETDEIEIEKQFVFTKTELMGIRNKNFNPKMLNTNYTNITIASSDGNNFEYDALKIGTNKLKFLYSEPLVPDVTKYYLRIKSPTGLYIEETNQNYTGLVGSVDNSIPVTNDQYSQYIANNKNFWLQSTGNNILNTATNALQSFASGNIVGGVRDLIGGVQTQVNTHLTIDNMKNAPSQLKNASGSALFNNNITGIGIYIEEYDALEHEKQQADDFMYKNGFEYGEIGNVADFDNIRTKFNYLSADVEIITANISNEEKTRLIERLKSVRFWNSDDIDYINENYERSILNG